jgi:predicted peptidase
MIRIKLTRYILLAIVITITMINVVYAESFIKLKSGDIAIEHLPKDFDKDKRYPVIIALHGMEQTARHAFNAWKGVADRMQMILLCPKGSDFQKGFSRKPTDDRKAFVRFLHYLDKKYKIDTSQSYLAGFSRGGNFAIETGVIYPNKFPNIICMFGFYNDFLTKILQDNRNRARFKRSRFYFITGKDDQTKESLKKGSKILNQYGIKTKVKTFPNLNHSYPSNLGAELKKINEWAFEKKE